MALDYDRVRRAKAERYIDDLLGWLRRELTEALVERNGSVTVYPRFHDRGQPGRRIELMFDSDQLSQPSKAIAALRRTMERRRDQTKRRLAQADRLAEEAEADEPTIIEPEPPCTCSPACPDACKGQCGCKACHDAYGDFLSSRE